ncbi:hypothetical protein HMPREF0204_13368 [Chryseobacterium gleum ATCC 35910]|uniref:Uncharacterized protein n=1 Tax=Chryseobacterium gleum ATCC 35910 TaxID=525257 RepID=A0ABN0AMK6_CHRGE|nr:hypothetical protein HMPREF0204_13368 [Chryseobacterium gleum ATCC 35910]
MIILTFNLINLILPEYSIQAFFIYIKGYHHCFYPIFLNNKIPHYLK